jgi:hypothetical protein
MRKYLLLLSLLCALCLAFGASAGPYLLTCPVTPVRSYMDITIEAHTGAPDDANIFVYNLTRDYEKIGLSRKVFRTMSVAHERMSLAR